MTKELSRIGYWASPGDEDSPYPIPVPDTPLSAPDKALLLSYLKGGATLHQYRGSSMCRICGKINGSTEKTDGMFLWPSGLAHYLEDHDVEIPQSLLIHARKHMGVAHVPTDLKPSAMFSDDFWLQWSAPVFKKKDTSPKTTRVEDIHHAQRARWGNQLKEVQEQFWDMRHYAEVLMLDLEDMEAEIIFQKQVWWVCAEPSRWRAQLQGQPDSPTYEAPKMTALLLRVAMREVTP